MLQFHHQRRPLQAADVVYVTSVLVCICLNTSDLWPVQLLNVVWLKLSGQMSSFFIYWTSSHFRSFGIILVVTQWESRVVHVRNNATCPFIPLTAWDGKWSERGTRRRTEEDLKTSQRGVVSLSLFLSDLFLETAIRLQHQTRRCLGAAPPPARFT